MITVPGLLQRQPAPGHQGRRPHRRARGPAHRQRADRSLAGLRAAEAGPGHHRGLRPRRRHLRHLHPPGQGRGLRGARHQRRHASGRRRLRPGAGGLAAGGYPAPPRGGPGRRRGSATGAAARPRRPPSADCPSRRAPQLAIPFGDFVYRRDITREELRRGSASGGARPSALPSGAARRGALARRRGRGGAGGRFHAGAAGAAVRWRRCSARRRTASSTPTRWWRWGRRCRPRSSPAGSPTCSCWTSPRCHSGIETLGGIVSVLIARNSTIPTMAKEQFTTSVDGQTVVDLHVLQGERELARDNRSLARFEPARHRSHAGGHAQDRGDLPRRRQRDPAGQRARAAHRQGGSIEVQPHLRTHRSRGGADGGRILRARGGRRERAAPHRGADRGRQRGQPRAARADARAALLAEPGERERIEAALARLREARARDGPRSHPRAHHRGEPGHRAAGRGHDGRRAQGALASSGRTASWSLPDGDAQGDLPSARRHRRGGRRQKYPLADHGRPGSLLDIALANDIHLEHNCGGSCACTTCHVIVREGEANLSPHGARRGRPSRHRRGPHAALAPRLPGDRARATSVVEIPK